MEVRLSQSQEQLWFAERIGARPSGYLVPMILAVKGRVVEAALESALTDIVARHEILRTRFFERDGELRGEVGSAAAFALETERHSDADLLDRGGIDAVLAAEAAAPLDVSTRMPIRAKLIRTAAEEQFLCVVVHHLVFDDWSRNRFYAELEERYRAHATGTGRALPPLEVQYHQYAVRRDERDGPGRRASIEHWRGVLRGLDPFELEPDRPRAARRRGLGAETRFAIEPELADAVTKIGIAQGASTAMVLFAAVQAALHRFTGRDDVTFGFTIAQRDEDESQELIGPLVNTVLLRGDMSGDPAFTEMVERMRDTMLDAMEHGDMPFKELLAEIGAATDSYRNPFSQIIVQYGSGVRRRPKLEGCEVDEVVLPATGSKYDLTILFDQLDDGRLIADIGWDRDLYEAGTVTSLADALRAVIEDVAAAPDKRLSAVRTLAEPALSELLGLQRGRRLEPGILSLSGLVEEQARLRPDAVAVVAHDGRECSYADLDGMADRVASLLRASGVAAETIVGVHTPRSLAQIAAMLGVLKAGAAYLPLDPAYPIERIRFMIEDSRAPVLLFEGALPPELREAVGTAIDVGNVEARDGEDRGAAPDRAGPDGSCALIYTSGSTGRPKGVLLTHRGLAGRLGGLQSEFPLEPSDRVLLKASCAFDMSILELFWPLAAGATVVLARPGGHRDPAYLIDLIRQERVTFANFVPSMLAIMADDEAMSDCTGLRLIMAGGEELHGSVVDRLRARLPDCRVYNGYGPTEISVCSSWRLCGTEPPGRAAVEPLGSPLPDTRMHVLDEWLNPVPPGGVGELHIGGPGLARGYLGRAGLTAERFVPDPFSSGERLYRTGDIVRYSKDTRSYRFLGRSDFQVKVGGVRIEIGEVEAALASHEAVAECAVVARRSGEGGGWRISAFVTLAKESGPDELLVHARRWLTPTAVPSSVVVFDALPTLPNGKVDRRRLLEMEAEAPAPVERETALSGDLKVLAEIWSEVLDTSGITAASNFFLSGGHSLLAIQMTNRVREWLDADVPLSLVFDAPVLGDFSDRLTELAP